MTDLRKLLSEARRDISHTMSCEYGAVIVRTVCCRSKATLRLEDMAPQLAAALLKAEEALRELVDRDAAYDGNRIIITADSHGDAIGRMSRARAALSDIKNIIGGGNG